MTRCLKCGVGYDHRMEKKCPKCGKPNPKTSRRWEDSVNKLEKAITDLTKVIGTLDLDPIVLQGEPWKSLIDFVERCKDSELGLSYSVSAKDLKTYLADVPNHARLAEVVYDDKNKQLRLRFQWELPKPDFLWIVFPFVPASRVTV